METLRLLGAAEIEAASAASSEGALIVDCEFCNQRYRFDAGDLGGLFPGRP
jgi:redox-regulated HSP33 family molecular chaperone